MSLGLEVREAPAAEAVGAAAVVLVVELVAGPDGRARGDHLEDGARGGHALDAPVEQRVVRALAGEAGVVLAGDAADPGVGVVVGLGGHRDDAAGLGLHDDDGARVGLVLAAGDVVGLVADDLHRVLELVLRDGLDPGVDARDEGGSGHARVGLGLAHDPAEVVDLVRGDFRLAAQLPVVGALDSGAADLVGPQVRRVGVLGLLDLVVGDRREVAEHLRGAAPPGAG